MCARVTPLRGFIGAPTSGRSPHAPPRIGFRSLGRGRASRRRAGFWRGLSAWAAGPIVSAAAAVRAAAAAGRSGGFPRVGRSSVARRLTVSASGGRLRRARQCLATGGPARCAAPFGGQPGRGRGGAARVYVVGWGDDADEDRSAPAGCWGGERPQQPHLRSPWSKAAPLRGGLLFRRRGPFFRRTAGALPRLGLFHWLLAVQGRFRAAAGARFAAGRRAGRWSALWSGCERPAFGPPRSGGRRPAAKRSRL